jgi:hypothetical protein
MADDRDNHIASDEDLLSRYALGRLNEAEREKVDRHTAGCSACTEALQREMRIAAGVRRLGREDLKERLRRRVATEPRPAGRPRILIAAALVGVIAGLGVYYAWFKGGETLPPLPGGSPPLAGRTESPRQDERNAPSRELADKVKGDGTAESSARLSGHLQADQKEPVSPAIPDAENDRRGAPAGGGAASRSKPAGEAPATEPAAEFWSDGIVERGDAALDAEAPPGAVASQEKNAVLFKSKALKEAEGRLKDARSRPPAQYLLRQQPTSALPADRERSGGEQQRVPTRVNQRGSTTTMTMYLDSLVDEREMTRARVEAVSDDSVVVTLGGKKILYRFPPGQSSQQQRQK